MATNLDGAPPRGKGLHYTLWTLQVLLALLFLFAGIMKLVTPAEKLAAMAPQFSVNFLRFIGVVETLGGLGMVLPGLLKIKTVLTPLAAAGLVIVMIGAVVVSYQMKGMSGVPVPLVTGIVAAFVAYGRWRMVPLPER
jgi:putative oxidoreductase